MYEVVIGMEVHAQLKTSTKMFCACRNNPDEKRSNVNICPTCLGHPGTLPVANKKALEFVVKVGHALNSKIAENTKFDRKNYFYPDIPKGYQISQYDMPICEGGFLTVGDKNINITRVHMEEDTAKSTHGSSGYSFVDFNRSSAPLMELVTEPDIRSADEARAFCEELQKILQYLDISDANMEKGQMRCELNISLRKQGEDKFGTKVEIKNLNSFKAVRDSAEFEIKRQTELLEKGDEVVQETRGWDENRKVTFSQRKKESAHDYRYFPEPDIPTFKIGKFDNIASINTIDSDFIKATLPELPKSKLERFKKIFFLPEKDAKIIVSDKYTAFYFENVVSELRNILNEENDNVCSDELKNLIKLAVNYINSDLKKILKESSQKISDIKMSEEDFAELMYILHEKKITSAAGKIVLLEMVKTGGDPDHIIEDKGLLQISDSNEISNIAKEVIDENPKPVSDYKSGNEKILKFLLGQVMAKSRGKANPKIAEESLKELLK